MAAVFGSLMLLTIAGIYFTRYVVVKNIVENLEKKHIQAHLIDANLISFSYQEDNYKMSLYASRGTTFALFYKNEKLIANEEIILSLIDFTKFIDGSIPRVEIKSNYFELIKILDYNFYKANRTCCI